MTFDRKVLAHNRIKPSSFFEIVSNLDSLELKYVHFLFEK